MASAKKLCRSESSVIGGVCAGIAEYLDVDPAAIRILAILLGCVSFGLAVAVYAILWVVLPRRMCAPEAIPCEGYAAGSPSGSAAPASDAKSYWSTLSPGVRTGIVGGTLLIVIGVMGALSSFFPRVSWYQCWPVAIVILGAVLMVMPSNSPSRVRRFCLGLAVSACGVVMTAVSADLVSASAAMTALEKMWPALMVALGLCFVGRAKQSDLFFALAALCVVLACIVAMAMYAQPGVLGYAAFRLPTNALHSFSLGLRL